jgi:2-dehydro-3-deoxyphosphogluconate aldolase / (4S)-4-hydroxy-2-oxoglutarate aldolase
MAKFDKIAVLNKIGSTGMVPVFYHKDAEVAKKVVKALLISCKRWIYLIYI